jgi:hypothetical protein
MDHKQPQPRTAIGQDRTPAAIYDLSSLFMKIMRFALISLMLACPLTALAGGQSDTFASGTVALLDRELPQMNKAVAENNRAYLGPALERVQAFLALWEKRQGPTVLERNPACTDAATDFLIVGLCKISPPGSICEPTTFFPKAERNIRQCRALAAPEGSSNKK